MTGPKCFGTGNSGPKMYAVMSLQFNMKKNLSGLSFQQQLWCWLRYLRQMLSVQTSGSAKMRKQPVVSSGHTGISLRCLVTFLLARAMLVCRAMTSLPFLQESSATWISAEGSGCNRIKLLQLTQKPSEDWDHLWSWTWASTTFQFFSLVCSQDWSLLKICTWVGTKFLWLSRAPSLNWGLSFFLNFRRITCQLSHLECSQDSSTWHG